jgi:hypothetical protein
MLTKRVKWRWALNGALITFLISWIDLFVEWRHVEWADWSGTGISYNLGQFFGAMMLGTLIGFVAGAVKDSRAARSGLLIETPEPDNTERHEYMGNLGVVGRLGVVLYWLGAGVGALCAVGAVAFISFGNTADKWFFATILAMSAVCAYLVGLAFRFIFAGPKPKSALPAQPSRHPSLLRPIATAAVIAAVIAGGRWAYDHHRNSLPGLWGNMRVTFVDGSVKSCERTQLQAPENKGLKPEVLRQYCKCYSEGLANKISMDEMKAAFSQPKERQSSFVLARHQQSVTDLAQSCASATLK